MPECRACGSRVERIHRRTIDKIYCIFKPVLRYRCADDKCRWEGNLPDPSRALERKRKSALVWGLTVGVALMFGALLGKYLTR